MTQSAATSSAAPAATRAGTFGAVWVVFLVLALLAMEVVDLTLWARLVPLAAVCVAAVTARFTPGVRWLAARPRWLDLLTIAALYVVVVGLLRLAFVGFGTKNLWGLFLSYAGALLAGVAGPVVYTVWARAGRLQDLGLGRTNLRRTLLLGVVLAVVQSAITLWGMTFPQPVDWVPLLVMSLMVGLFEAIFFRGFVQMRLERSFGAPTGVAGGALLYSLYHVGYGMGSSEMVFLFGLGVVYAIAYRLVENILVLWPLLTPLGGFFNTMQAGDIELPWASIAGFADVLGVMAAVLWLAARHQRRTSIEAASTPALPSS